MLIFFFFYYYADYRDLHSFPTRRSSDLRHLGDAIDRRLKLPRPRLRLPAALDVERSREARSEEHTSELQSRQYLVCRLLLEKKNYKMSGRICDKKNGKVSLPYVPTTTTI